MNVIKVNVAVASPSDVLHERNAIHKVFTRWNNKNTGVVLVPVMWEYDAVPGLGAHPQDILDRQIIDRSDLLIAILWSKFGTPTASAGSGTEQEIREFIKLKGPQRVMLYFCTRPISPKNVDAEQLVRLNTFKTAMQKQGVYHEFETTEEFERDLYAHLDAKVNDLINERLPLPVIASTAASRVLPNKGFPIDKRLLQLIDFGTTIEEIAVRFSKRMDEFDQFHGYHNDKFYGLAGHVYRSVAVSLDQAMTKVRLSETSRAVLERVSGKLKKLAAHEPKSNEVFQKYWDDGRELSDELNHQVKLINEWRV